MARSPGQATVEWIGVVLVVALLAGGLMTFGVGVDGRSLGGLLAHRLTCAVAGRCDAADTGLERAYGLEDARLVRDRLPGLVYELGERQVPVDWRECREARCAGAPTDRDLDVHRTIDGNRVTAFTRLLRQGGRRYVQYWFYYPDSNTTFANSDRIWRQNRLLKLGGLIFRGTSEYPGYHRDDWEAAAVRVGREGRTQMRVTSHGHWQWCKWSRCREQWGPATGWARVSRGSHAGHVPVEGNGPAIPGRDLRERTTSADGIRLIPIETLDRDSYRRLDPGIAPPWEKRPYRDPESPES